MTGFKDFPYYEVEGDPVGIGLSYGRKTADRIGVSLDIYRPIFEEAGVSWDAALGLAAGYIEQLRHFDADQAIELCAIAKGAGVTAEEIMLINARTDVIYGGTTPPNFLDDGCTGAIAMPEVTQDGDVIHGQNWDWRSDCKDSVVIVQRHPNKGPASLNLFEAGTLTRCGLNAHGVAMTANFLRCNHDPGRGGIPSPFVRRRALSASNYTETVECMMGAQRSFSNNLMLSDARGIAVDLEMTPHEYYWLKPENGLLVHANHFKSQAGLARVFDTGLSLSADSLFRDDRVHQFLTAARGRITVDTMLEALADDFCAPASVNRPPSLGGVQTDDTATVASIVMNVTQRTMTVVATPYAQRHASTYRLSH